VGVRGGFRRLSASWLATPSPPSPFQGEGRRPWWRWIKRQLTPKCQRVGHTWKMTTQTSSRRIVRTALPAWVIFGGILGPTVLFGAFVAITKEPALWYPTAASACGLAVIFSWLGTTTLTLKEDAVQYRALFVTREVPLMSIDRVEFTTEPSPFKPYQRVCFLLRDKPKEDSIVVNAGLFDPTQIVKWVHAVNARLQELT
jgi:hypothetical protein